jgi:hypothetical protein
MSGIMTPQDISKLLKPSEYLLFSEKLHEFAEDLEDMYWVKKNKNSLDRSTYKNADVLDACFSRHEDSRKSKVSQRVSKHS